MSDYPMLISNKLHSFRNFFLQKYHNFACKFNVFLYIANLLLIISV